jgi:hypothetical protein
MKLIINPKCRIFDSMEEDGSGVDGFVDWCDCDFEQLVPSYEVINSQPKFIKALPGPLWVDHHWVGSIDSIVGPEDIQAAPGLLSS